MNETQISELLISMGFIPSYRGYPCLVHVLWLSANDSNFLLPPVKTLYLETAACFQISPASVQHSIRTLLEAFWNRKDSMQRFNSITHYPVKEPLSPKEFIAVLADCLRRMEK